MDIFEANFVNNYDTEVQRLIHTAKQVWGGFYAEKGYRVLPYLINTDPGCIYFPESGFTKIEGIREVLKRIKLDFPIKYSKKLANQIRFKYEPIEVAPYRKSWQKVESDFWKMAIVLFPNQAKLIKSLEIRITRYGSISSFQFLQKKNMKKLIIYLRIDADISHIAEAILLCLLNSNTLGYEKSWEDNKRFANSLLQKTDLSEIFPQYKSLKTNKNQDSQKYIRELGIKIPLGLSLIGRKIYLDNKLISNTLSKIQYQILFYILQNGRHFIDHQKISEIVWGDDQDKFSLWAIEKMMQRLRNKLISLGASNDWLKTLRGRGYLLDNG